MKNERRSYRKLPMVSALIGSLVIAGCAGNSSIPAEKIAGAEKSIDQASRTNAVTDAAVELKSANDHLVEAKAAMADKDYDKASRLADMATSDADLAQAKASTAKAKKAARDMRDSVNTLKRELNQPR